LSIAFAIVLILGLIPSYIYISYGYNSHNHYSIRNIGFGETSGEQINASLLEEFDLDYLQLIESLLKAAELIEEYNETLSNQLLNVAENLATMNQYEALALYEEILPSLISLLEQLAETDPELYMELTALLPTNLADVIKYNDIPSGVLPSNFMSGEPIVKPDFVKVNSVLGGLPNINLYYIIFLIAIISLPILLYFSYMHREILAGRILKGLSKSLRGMYIGMKLGSKPKIPRDIIIYNYRKFLLHMKMIGLEKRRYETPREYLSRLDVEFIDKVRELTYLFEIAKYTAYDIGTEEAAMSDEIVNEIEAMINV
jgi:hypothetical protein